MKRGIAQHWYALIWQLEVWTWMLTMSSCLTSHRIRYALHLLHGLIAFTPIIVILMHIYLVIIFCVFRLIIFTELEELHAWEPKVTILSYNCTHLLALYHFFANHVFYSLWSVIFLSWPNYGPETTLHCWSLGYHFNVFAAEKLCCSFSKRIFNCSLDKKKSVTLFKLRKKKE